MPRKASLVVPKKPRTSRRAKSPVLAAGTSHAESSVCHACRSFPIGSVELVSLLLVLVFSLSAVLITSGYALSQQHDRLVEVEAQLHQ